MRSGGVEVDAHASSGGGAGALLELAELGDQPLGLLDARLGLGGARLGPALSHSISRRTRLRERVLVLGLVAQHLVALFQEVAVAARAPGRARRDSARFELQHAGGDVLQEIAVVAHHHKGERLALEQLFQPEDALDVEVVRGLVEQQDVRAPAPARGRWPDACASRRRARPPAGPDRRTPPGRAGRPPRSPSRRPRKASSARAPVRTSSTVVSRREDGILGDVADAGAACGPSGSPCRRCSMPARMLRKVDLPEPFGPMSPTWSPSKRPKESPSNSGWAPKPLVRDSQVRRTAGGIGAAF